MFAFVFSSMRIVVLPNGSPSSVSCNCLISCSYSIDIGTAIWQKTSKQVSSIRSLDTVSLNLFGWILRVKLTNILQSDVELGEFIWARERLNFVFTRSKRTTWDSIECRTLTHTRLPVFVVVHVFDTRRGFCETLWTETRAHDPWQDNGSLTSSNTLTMCSELICSRC
jgi:hypothetical protein